MKPCDPFNAIIDPYKTKGESSETGFKLVEFLEPSAPAVPAV